MTSEEFRALLPGALGFSLDEVPGPVADAFRYLQARDALIESGTAVADLPTYEEWRHG